MMHLVARAQRVQEDLGAGQRRQAGDHGLDVCQLQALLAQQRQAEAHQLVVVGLVARGAAEGGDAGAFGEGDPDLGDEDPFQVQADDVHAGFRDGDTPS